MLLAALWGGHNVHCLCPIGIQTDLKRAEVELLCRAEESRSRNEELERFNRVTLGQEVRIIELEQQVNELCAKPGQSPRYHADDENEG